MADKTQPPDGRLVLDPDLLTPRDLRRAKDALADILGDRDPMQLADPIGNDFGEWFAFMVWVFRSRTDPSFTWEQALDVPFGEASLPFGTAGADAAPNGAAGGAEAPAAPIKTTAKTR